MGNRKNLPQPEPPNPALSLDAHSFYRKILARPLAADTIGMKLCNTGDKIAANRIEQGHAIYKIASVLVSHIYIPCDFHHWQISSAKTDRLNRLPIIRCNTGEIYDQHIGVSAVKIGVRIDRDPV